MPPIEGLILPVILAEGESCDRLGHLITKIESMAGIDIIPAMLGKLVEKGEGVAGSQMQAAAHQMNFTPLREHPEVRVANRVRQLIEGLVAMRLRFSPAERYQPRLDMFGQGFVGHRVIHQPPGEVAFPHTAAGPVNDLGGQHRADARLLAKAEQ